MFPMLSTFVEENESDDLFSNSFQSLLTQHLEPLKDEVSRYFPEEPPISSTLLQKPFVAKIDNAP